MILPGREAGGTTAGWTIPLTGSTWGSFRGGARSTFTSLLLFPLPVADPEELPVWVASESGLFLFVLNSSESGLFLFVLNSSESGLFLLVLNSSELFVLEPPWEAPGPEPVGAEPELVDEPDLFADCDDDEEEFEIDVDPEIV